MAAVAVLFDRFLPGFALQKKGTPLRGDILKNADSRGGALLLFAPFYEQDALSGLEDGLEEYPPMPLVAFLTAGALLACCRLPRHSRESGNLFC
ncbi:MAG: hypothetical protein ACR2P4_00670 [Gammaproteobacteria bacterium]